MGIAFLGVGRHFLQSFVPDDEHLPTPRGLGAINSLGEPHR